MSLIRIYLLITLCLLALPVLAERPKIGLALAGGGAKGSAHIAVLAALEANNIPVDFIAGTSIGAYVGGLYALGYTAAEIREIMWQVDLNRGFSDAIEREELSYRSKQHKDRFNVSLDIGYRDGAVRFPGGLLYGQTMSELYRRSVGNMPNFDSFDQLPIPFRAVATDLVTSEVVVLSGGNLVEAMQASATVPGALVPVEIDGRILVDGGLAENLPISQVRRMGADIIIVVDTSAPLLGRDQLDNTVSVLRQLSHFLTLENIYRQKELLQKDDIYLRPDIDGLSATDFSRLQLAYDSGLEAAQNKLLELRALSIARDDYVRYRQIKRDKFDALQRGARQPVVEIELRNRSDTSEAFILETLGVRVGKPISTEELAAAVRRVYALDRFERVEAEFVDRAQGRVLVIEARGKSWGPNHFSAGLGWEDDFTLDSIINVDFAYTLGDITDNDGEWRNEIGIGTNKYLKTELYLPMGASQKFYNATRYELHNESRDLIFNDRGNNIFELTLQRIDLGIGYRWIDAGIVEAGLTYQHGDIENELVQQDDLSFDSPGLYFRIGYDTLDRFSFPSRGSRWTAAILHRDEDVSGDLITGNDTETDVYRSTQLLLDWKGAISRDNHGIVGRASFAGIDSDAGQSVHYVPLGGFLNLSGYHKNALIGNRKVFGAVTYQYNLGRSLFGLTGFPLYIGASVEAGNVWLAPDSVSADELITAGTLFISTDTRLGPVALGFGFAENDQNSVYFYLGKRI